MIATGNRERCCGNPFGEAVEGVNHEFETLIGSPFPERKNSMSRIAAHREIGEFRTPCENSVCSQMDVIPPVFVIQNLAISRHQH